VGGGSIAWADLGGALRVGPGSAGARPGPAAYGLGGDRPTVTDANVVLGRLPADAPLGGRIRLDADAARAAVGGLADELGMGLEACAEGILAVAVQEMTRALRLVSVERGEDPRDAALIAFGGAGPLHATALARELGLPKVLVPARPGITNALGCVVADLRHDFVNTVNQPVAGLDETQLHAILERHRNEGEELIGKEAVKPETIRVTHSADMQFVGQTHIINVPLPSSSVTRAVLQQLFEKAYFARFKVELPEIRANLVNLNTSVTGVRPAIDLSRLIDPAGRARTLDEARREIRPVWYGGRWHDTPVYSRERLPLEAVIEGPAILEQMDATTVLEPGDRARSDADGNIIIDIGEA
jgi:N-methylhydantoinase A